MDLYTEIVPVKQDEFTVTLYGENGESMEISSLNSPVLHGVLDVEKQTITYIKPSHEKNSND